MARHKMWPLAVIEEPQQPPSLNLDFRAMRARILHDMHIVMKPYQDELAEIDAAERVLMREASLLQPVNLPVEERRQRAEVVPMRKKKPKALLKAFNGPYGAYNNMIQRDCVLDILAKHPGSTNSEIAEQMRTGGFQFKTNNATASILVCLRHMEIKGLVKSERLQRTGKGPQKRYALPGQEFPLIEEQTDELKDKPLTESVVLVLLDASPKGMLRDQIYSELLRRGFSFKGKSKPHFRHVTWTLQTLVDGGKVLRSGGGSTALFSVIKPKFAISGGE